MSTPQKILMTFVGLLFIAEPMPAYAVTLTFGGTQVSGQGQFSSIPGVTTIDFESGVPTSGLAAYSAPSPGPTIVSGNLSNTYAALAFDNTRYLTVAPFGDGRGTNPVLIQFANPLDYFGFYWGSIDPHNAISFYREGVLLNSFTGAGISLGSRYANFSADMGESFDTVRLSSTNAAFETDNHAYRVASLPDSAAVPEPTTIAGLAIAGSGFLAARRQRKQKRVDSSLS